jgi:hypothetical protein
VVLWTISNELTKLFNIVTIGALRISENFGHQSRHNNFINSAIRIWGDDSTTREVNTLSRQILTETTVLTFNSLAQRSDRLVA